MEERIRKTATLIIVQIVILVGLAGVFFSLELAAAALASTVALLILIIECY